MLWRIFRKRWKTFRNRGFLFTLHDKKLGLFPLSEQAKRRYQLSKIFIDWKIYICYVKLLKIIEFFVGALDSSVGE